MDYMYSYYLDYIDGSRIDSPRIDLDYLKEYVKRKAVGELARSLMEKAEVQEDPLANRIVVKISV